MAWQDDLLPASWRGVPFQVDVGDTSAGRNTAVHPYPFRETNPVWVEDLGLAVTSMRVVGFLIGEDVADQQNTMIAAMQGRGPGELVHPMLGSLIGSVVGGCRFVMRRDRGRYIEIAFDFVENADVGPFPVTETATGPAVDDAASGAERASDASTDAAAPAADQGRAVTEAGAVNNNATSISRTSLTPQPAGSSTVVTADSGAALVNLSASQDQLRGGLA